MSAKIEYAGKAVLELALRQREQGSVRIATIAKSQNIPKGFLLQLMIRLKNAGIVKSARGKAGGYSLAKDPSFITLADIVRAVDEALLARPEYKKGRRDPADKVLQEVWKSAHEELERQLETVTLEDLKTKMTGGQMTYSI
ncbi:MAG: Rrf2 family transcriptional regulator [Candidatus Omnitrophota bacterium]